ncbi:MAG: methylmalonyl-CoA epimerase [Rhodothermia bacterium]|nr:MAG: methylmalonyl-CoA epimerase [Rhodothermia bacterium]
MRLEHVGIAVRDAEEALKTFEALLGKPRYKVEDVPSESVRTHFFGANGVKIEILESLDPNSPVARFIRKRGEGLHHLAFSVQDLDATIERMRQLGFEIVGDGIRSGADEKRVFFIHPKSANGVLIECCTDQNVVGESDDD